VEIEAFRADAEAAGYTDFYRRDLKTAGDEGPHTHDFDARVMVTGGSIKLTIAGTCKTYSPGDWCEVPAGTVHAEELGPDGVQLLVAKRAHRP